MKVKKLIEELKYFDEELEVKYKNEGVLLPVIYPFTDTDEDNNRVVVVGI